MLSVSLTKDYKVIQSILYNSRLFQACNGHSNIPEAKPVATSSEWLLISDNDTIIGCFELKKFTAMIVEGHIQILPDFWGTNTATKSMDKAISYLKEHTSYSKIITYVPFNCESVHKLLAKSKFKPCGQIENGCIYNNKYNNLILYKYNLKDVENAI